MKLRVYMEEAYNELVHKVSWPTWKELQNSAVMVMVAS
jgi:preprotein translocase subunit SecE